MISLVVWIIRRIAGPFIEGEVIWHEMRLVYTSCRATVMACLARRIVLRCPQPAAGGVTLAPGLGLEQAADRREQAGIRSVGPRAGPDSAI